MLCSTVGAFERKQKQGYKEMDSTQRNVWDGTKLTEQGKDFFFFFQSQAVFIRHTKIRQDQQWYIELCMFKEI